jgi:hypothetical protein
MKEAMELNQKPSEMFELRNMAILKRYEAEKEQIEQEKGSQGKQEELENLEEWYREELESLQSEKKKITKGWFTSIEAVRKIKRDLEFVADVKKQPTLVQKASKYSNEPTVFNLISRSLGSPTSKHMDKEGRKLAKEVSPMISPHATSNYSQAKIISDPNIMSMKIKQGDILRKNEELAKSIEHLDPNKLKRNRSDMPSSGIEISDAKKMIVKEIDENLYQNNKPRKEGQEIFKTKHSGKQGSPYGSPINPSHNSSNLYNISPTSMKRQSKNSTSNKPRNTIKSDLINDERPSAEDIICIKDQSRKDEEVVINEDFERSHSKTSLISEQIELEELAKEEKPFDGYRTQKDLNTTGKIFNTSLGKAQIFTHEDYLNDLTQGIGFDSQMIKNDFEDTKKSSYALDDFASMSDSDREVTKRNQVVHKVNLISDDILDLLLTDTITDIIQMLESDNIDLEREISAGLDQQIYLQDGNGQLMHMNGGLVYPHPRERRGIRVNCSAIKEYLSLLNNYIKSNLEIYHQTPARKCEKI